MQLVTVRETKVETDEVVAALSSVNMFVMINHTRKK